MSEPSAIRPGRTGTVIVDYSNTGGSDIPAPLFVLTATEASLELPGSVVPAGATLDFLGINPTGPAGVLPPGASGTAVIDFTPTSLMSGENSGGLIQFNLGEVPEDSTPIDWSSQESALQPSNIPDSAWGAVFTNFVASVGSTTGQYVAELDADATYLSQLGESTDDVSRLLGFEILKADAFYTAATLATVTDASYPTPVAIPLDFVRQFNASIGGRDQSGPLGDGWTDNWQISAAADAQGDVTITDDGSTSFFTLQPDGSYMSKPGDYDTLTLVDGAYQLRATDGTLTAFNPNGSLAYIEDANGNRVNATDNAAGQLTVLTASDGSALTIAYNAQGLISQVTDPAGQTTTYSYDASGQHLIAYTDMYGTTKYTYLTGPTAADANALASIAYADDTHLYYSYDAQGRLTGTSRDGGAEALTYTYGAVGGYTITDADHNATTILQDDMGLIVQTTDPLGNITRYTYDADSNLTEIVAADGTTTTFTYDSLGNLTSETDALGNVTRFTYDPTFSQLVSSTDPRGNTTTYGIDANGNVTSMTAPDGSVQQYTYNSLGEVVEWTNADNQSTLCSYNTNGELTNELFPDGTSNSYSYDDRGNLLTATGPSGDWSFVYNSLNLPTQITEPNGALTYSYNVVGQTTQMVETTGSSTFTVNYLYDALGRLEQLTDANGNNIDTYSYDPAGSLVGEAKATARRRPINTTRMATWCSSPTSPPAARP
jgi:YD repeat-containing protein